MDDNFGSYNYFPKSRKELERIAREKAEKWRAADRRAGMHIWIILAVVFFLVVMGAFMAPRLIREGKDFPWWYHKLFESLNLLFVNQ